jgi:lipid II:glycine glycyltransferase (peptidoglycan interpeptide bridge formation enzyme)
LATNPLDCIELLKEYDSRFGNRAIYTQIRNINDQHNQIEGYKATGYRYKPHLTSLVRTGGFTEEDVLNRMSKSRSRQIRKGLEYAEVVEATSEVEFGAFYSILKQLYTTRVGKPLPHISFFDNFRKYTLPAGLGKLLLVKAEGKTIGGILCAIMPGKTIYEWYIAGLDDEHKAFHPSVLATWAAIRFAVRNGLDHFDFLGAGSPESSYGVRDFKERFGGETVEYGRFEKIHQPMLMKIGTFGIRMKQWIR